MWGGGGGAGHNLGGYFLYHSPFIVGSSLEAVVFAVYLLGFHILLSTFEVACRPCLKLPLVLSPSIGRREVLSVPQSGILILSL